MSSGMHFPSVRCSSGLQKIFICSLLLQVAGVAAFGPINFDSTSTVTFDGVNVTIGWLQFLRCDSKSQDKLSAASNYNSNYTKNELFDLLQYAVTAQIGPKSNVPGINETADYTVTAKLCSNPVFALNNQYEMSFTVDMTSDPTEVTGFGEKSNWNGTEVALEYLTQTCMYYKTSGTFLSDITEIIGLEPKALENAVYDSCGADGYLIADDLTENGMYYPWCTLRSGDNPGYDVGVWLGFDVNMESYCQLRDDGDYTFSKNMFLGDGAMNVYEAYEYCLQNGGELLSIHDELTQKAAEDLCESFDHNSYVEQWDPGCWIGLYQPNSAESVEWLWTDGSATDYGLYDNGTAKTGQYPWSGAEPTNHFGGEDYVQISTRNFQWNDVYPGTSSVPICQETWTTSPTTEPTSEPTNDPTTPSASPSIHPSHEPTSMPTTNQTRNPTFSPSAAPSSSPTNAPSVSPTQYPIIYSEFEYFASASFNITGWTSSDILEVKDDLTFFTSSLTTYVHRGFDNDDLFEYRDVVLNITFLNEYSLNDLLLMDDSETGAVLSESMDYGMGVQYLVNCSDILICSFLAIDDPTDGLDRNAFEEFVSNQLNLHFTSMDADNEKSSELELVVLDILLNTTWIDSTINYGLGTENDDASRHIVIFAIVICVFVLSGIIYRRYCKKKPLFISNALVAMISIGDYSDGDKMAETEKEIPGNFINLPVEKDIETLKDLCSFMGWTFISKKQKVHWTESEIMSFIKTEIGEMLFTEDGSLNYDGLIVCVSCHGIKHGIVTSDFKAMEKTAIHRILSLRYPELREIPRIFVFDCCNGVDQRRVTIDEGQDQSKAIELTESLDVNKNIVLDDLQHLNSNRKHSWTSSTKNPDYNLVEIHAANSGYVAKMSFKGSYLVHILAKAIKRSCSAFSGQGLAALLEEVQNALHDTGHQQTVNILNNHTRTMVFKKNKRK